MAVDGESLSLGDEEALEAVRRFGTPLYLLDEGVLRARVRRWKAAFAAADPGSRITYASKANSTLALLRIVWQEGAGIDAASEGELRAAEAAGIPAGDCHLHGNNKSLDELAYALERGIGQIVVDSFEELDRLKGLGRSLPPLLLRLAPGVRPLTHEKISVGRNDTKFGFNMGDGQAEAALARCLEQGFPVQGFHSHVGSQLVDPQAQVEAGTALGSFARAMKEKHGFKAAILNLGGGMGVPMPGSPDPLPVEEYCQILAGEVRRALAGSGLNPILVQEPGRSIAAPAGATLYTAGTVKRAPLGSGGHRIYVSVDGGMADNPRPALYGARYSVRDIPVGRKRAGFQTVTVAGRHCENDVLFRDLEVDSAIQAGDVLLVAMTGAYNSSMSSRYNRYPRPATVLRRLDGSWEIVQERESWQDLLRSERMPEGLDGTR